MICRIVIHMGGPSTSQKNLSPDMERYDDVFCLSFPWWLVFSSRTQAKQHSDSPALLYSGDTPIYPTRTQNRSSCIADCAQPGTSPILTNPNWICWKRSCTQVVSDFEQNAQPRLESLGTGAHLKLNNRKCGQQQIIRKPTKYPVQGIQQLPTITIFDWFIEVLELENPDLFKWFTAQVQRCSGEIDWNGTGLQTDPFKYISTKQIKRLIIIFQVLVDGKMSRKHPYLKVKSMVSCRFSHEPTQWHFA